MIAVDAASLSLPMTSEVWSKETEVSSILGLNICLMLTVDCSFARGKCSYKLIQFMACGLPVVASPVGVDTSLVVPRVNGFLANLLAKWGRAFEALAKDPLRRYRMGMAVFAKMERQYCLEAPAPLLAGWLAEAIGITAHH